MRYRPRQVTNAIATSEHPPRLAYLQRDELMNRILVTVVLALMAPMAPTARAQFYGNEFDGLLSQVSAWRGDIPLDPNAFPYSLPFRIYAGRSACRRVRVVGLGLSSQCPEASTAPIRLAIAC